MHPEDIDERTDDARWRLRDHFELKVSHELELINNRMSWLVTSESFLFIAWAHSGIMPDSGALPLVVSVVGLCVGLAGFFSIGAAMRVHERMSAIYLDAIERAMKLPPTGYRREDRWTLLCGNIAVVMLPSLFAAVWAGAAYQSLHGNPVMFGSRALIVCIVVFVVGVLSTIFLMWRPWDDHWKELNLREPLMD